MAFGRRINGRNTRGNGSEDGDRPGDDRLVFSRCVVGRVNPGNLLFPNALERQLFGVLHLLLRIADDWGWSLDEAKRGTRGEL